MKTLSRKWRVDWHVETSVWANLASWHQNKVVEHACQILPSGNCNRQPKNRTFPTCLTDGTNGATEIAEVLSGFAQVALNGRAAHVRKLGCQFFQMPTSRRVNNDGLILPGALNLSDAVAESLEPLSGLRGAEVHVQFVAFRISHKTPPTKSSARRA